MYKDIKAKLDSQLSQLTHTEQSVVYTFIETRKILERQGLLSKYPIVNFYADWVVHTQLDRQHAQKVLTNIEGVFNGNREHDADVSVVDDVYPIISFSKLKTEFVQVCHDLNLPTDIFKDGVWNPFVHQLLNVISDCPLVMPSKTGSLIKQFQFKPPLDEGHVEFEVELNSGIILNGVTNFAYVDHNRY